MNFVKNHLHQLAGAFLLAVALTATGWLYFDLSIPAKAKAVSVAAADGHNCSLHSERANAESGGCESAAAASKAHAQHAGCAHEQGTCCSSKQAGSSLKLPPGHPPIPGYTVEAAPAMEKAALEAP